MRQRHFEGEKFQTQNWGLIDYELAWAKQTDLQSEVINQGGGYLIYCEHPSVYTAGRRTAPEDRPVDLNKLNGAKVIDVNRGGKITWHGPGQLVIYPIFTLQKRNDVVGYVRVLETAIIDAIKDFSNGKLQPERYCERTGVWFRDPANPSNDRKIAAIGIRVSKGVTLHGTGININSDLSAFDAINPCGFTDTGVTSLSRELGREVTIAEFLPTLAKHLIPALEAIQDIKISNEEVLDETVLSETLLDRIAR